MIQLHVAEANLEGMYKVVWVIGSVLGRWVCFCASHMKSRELRMLAVY
jgi:hypothetical protein